MLNNNDYQNGYYTGICFAYCESVKSGCKPGALLMAPLDCKDRIIAEVRRHDLYFWQSPRPDDWIDLYIFANPFYQQIISKLNEIKKPEIIAHWISGKLFGYSDTAILDWITSISQREPNQRPCVDNCSSNMEEPCSPSRITCGNAILSGSKVLCDHNIVELREEI
jgi:hypothetical protein